jgi:hypothetical protein
MKLLLTITIDTLNKMSPKLAHKTLEIMVEHFGEPNYKSNAMGWEINSQTLELIKNCFDQLPTPEMYTEFMKNFEVTVI